MAILEGLLPMKKNYLFITEETLRHQVLIEANSEEDARNKLDGYLFEGDEDAIVLIKTPHQDYEILSCEEQP